MTEHTLFLPDKQEVKAHKPFRWWMMVVEMAARFRQTD